ncbi:MAG: outer membrane protein assembly factor BamE [Woeseiaceae bacterium]|nr:outer membrane protein assembly factor BamE [Gammaproteobacteria bacterium]NNF48578.1 outer membrane protein assembly factor BamE [Woeseiaceae bacterium]NNK26164.1 outer membrane protein assembly factor BamE [Woeseiaceae bacterium]
MINRKWTAFALATIVLVVTSGCVYRASIAQGNFLEEQDLEQLEIGMTRNQVRFLLGTPMVGDPFHRDRWDYVYYIKVGRDATVGKRWLTVMFSDDVVSEIRKDQDLDPRL